MQAGKGKCDSSSRILISVNTIVEGFTPIAPNAIGNLAPMIATDLERWIAVVRAAKIDAD
jgi:hypothetical protein